MRHFLPGNWTLIVPRPASDLGIGSTLTIATNGDYVCLRTNTLLGSFDKSTTLLTNKLEGTFEVKNGVLIDIIKKSSITNETMPIIFSNPIVIVDNELFGYRNQESGQVTYLKRDTR